jgi:hypothetical protein
LWGQSAASEDFQKAFDAANTGSRTTAKKAESGRKDNPKNSPKTLDNLFDLWVYGVSNTNSR